MSNTLEESRSRTKTQYNDQMEDMLTWFPEKHSPNIRSWKVSPITRLCCLSHSLLFPVSNGWRPATFSNLTSTKNPTLVRNDSSILYDPLPVPHYTQLHHDIATLLYPTPSILPFFNPYESCRYPLNITYYVLIYIFLLFTCIHIRDIPCYSASSPRWSALRMECFSFVLNDWKSTFLV